ncbi:DUF4355 domain-containing protein [Oceanobacillus indicireducens]|uniref:DUF4355 domain-containing protein n=1 Tax=Oceanobacillus indicireducens TaxID=1004261 RepID=A0A918D4J1_9BACI|nr:DUF4355 domain-containing protein [Oceanobacillus indicireducens]GGN64311.1 hypothetical protein GCM10007971_32050 [Oceanobacillus indicireducens]
MNLADKVKELAETTLFTESDIAADVVHRTKRGLPLDLQFFAEGGEEGGEGEGTGDGKGQGEGAGSGEGEGGGKETFTRSEVDSEISKAVDKALKNREAKHQEDLQKAVNDALAEKERLAKLSEKERQEEELTQREKEIAEREAKIQRAELKADAVSDLQEKGLPAEFAEILLGEDAEKTLENINNFKTAFDKAVNDAVKEKLRQDTPPAGGSGFSTTENLGKQLAKLNKQNSVDVEKAQGNYFK